MPHIYAGSYHMSAGSFSFNYNYISIWIFNLVVGGVQRPVNLDDWLFCICFLTSGYIDLPWPYLSVAQCDMLLWKYEILTAPQGVLRAQACLSMCVCVCLLKAPVRECCWHKRKATAFFLHTAIASIVPSKAVVVLHLGWPGRFSLPHHVWMVQCALCCRSQKMQTS